MIEANFLYFLIGFIFGILIIDLVKVIYEKIYYKKEKYEAKQITINGINYFFNPNEPNEINKGDIWFEEINI